MPEDKITAADLRGFVLFAAFVYLAITFIGAIAGILLVFGITLLATVILNPIVTFLERYRVPRALSAFVLAISLLGLIGLVFWLILPRLVTEFTQLATQLQPLLMRIQDWLRNELPGLARRIPTQSTEVLIQQAAERIVPLLGGLTGYAVNVANLLVSALVIFVSTIYALSNPRPLVQGFLALFTAEKRDKIIDTIQQISVQMRAWGFGTIIGMILIFLLTWVVLELLGLRAAFLVAVISGILEIVPVLGPFIAGAVAVLVALGQDPMLALWVLLAFVAIQQIEGQFIVPLVMSGQLQLHPVSIIFAVLVMGGLFGIVGVFLAAPAAAITKSIVYSYFIEARTGAGQQIPRDAEQIVSGPDEDGKAEQ
ncbi:MAG: AI-2E family transporter [Armatimonadetes bacterium]|nr:AI-2E family transporter [Armatimonadota bacterium]